MLVISKVMHGKKIKLFYQRKIFKKSKPKNGLPEWTKLLCVLNLQVRITYVN